MKLSFYARAEHCVPYGTRAAGHIRRYVGRTYEHVGDAKSGVVGKLVAAKEPQAIDESDPQFADVVDHARRGGLWPADKQTAEFLGVEFVPVELGKDGEYAPRAPSKRASNDSGSQPQG